VRAAAYVRVLPPEEARARLGEADQLRLLEEFIAEQGWDLVGVHSDIGVDARPRNRPALLELLSDLSGVDKLVVLKLDRFGRSLRRTLEIVEGLEAAGVHLVSVEEGLDTGTPAGRMLRKVLLDLAFWEWDDRRGDDWGPENLRKPGLDPATVIDVGVAQGTESLYQAFPGAHNVLIEPLHEFEQHLKRLVAKHGGEYHLTAAGAEEGKVSFNVDRQRPGLSSILLIAQAQVDPEQPGREIPVTTLDALWKRQGWRGPFGLKIDTEGFEDQVILGATELLRETQFVIAEVSVGKRFEGSYSFADFVSLMSARGFRLCDILHTRKSWREKEITYVDAMFRTERGS
jgi:FkbM family methyltransferase